MASPLVRKTSWKDRLAKTFGSAEKDRDKNKDTKLENKEEEWCFVDGPAMETAFTERASPDSRKKPPRGVSSSVLGGKGPASGSPSSSRVSRTERLPRPGSPNPTGVRRTSATSRSRLDVQGQQNGGKASPRSVSPVRSNLKKKSSMSSNPTPRPDTNSDLPVQQTHLKQNGKVTDSPPATFSKIRDTLRISKPKRKKGVARSAYSVYQYSAPEINLSQPSKYKDPFEVSYSDSTDEPRLGQGHDFKPVSIPHNKPEYCDHCGEMAWGLYRQVLKCPKCDFICHRKCEAKVIIDCSARLEQAVLQHDKQVEETAHAPAEEENDKDTREEPEVIVPILRTSSASSGSSLATTEHTSDHMATGGGGGSSSHHSSQVLLTEKMKMIKKIRDYNRKTTPVHHIHIKSTRDHHNVIEYQGFVRVHMCVQRPIHVSTAITRTSWYRLMRPVKERSNSDVDAGFETAFYLPTDTNRLVHIHNATSTKELIQILLKKFCVTDNPKKFSLYEEYGSDARRLFEEDSPLTVVLEASCAHRNSKLVLRDNTYSTIQWDAFTLPELSNFIQILHREEEIYAEKLEERFKLWRNCISQVMKANCMDSVSRQTKMNVMAASSQPGSRLPKSKKKVESVV